MGSITFTNKLQIDLDDKQLSKALSTTFNTTITEKNLYEAVTNTYYSKDEFSLIAGR